MARSLTSELDDLKTELLRMGTLVEEAIGRAVRSLAERDVELAREVIRGDDEVDELALAIEQRCLTLFALHQPVASDLRAVGTALKIVTDLERMADHAEDIAKVAVRLDGQPLIKPLIDLPRMARLAEEMTRESLTAYVRRDADLAYRMIARDDEVDGLYRQIFNELVEIMARQPQAVDQGIHLLFVSQYLERIADHATNVGEWVIYMVTGRREELNN